MLNRRSFLHTTVGTISAISAITATSALSHLAAEEPVNPTRSALGLDAHSLRGMKWQATALINYAAEQRLDAVLLNSLNYFESLEDAHLQSLKQLLTKHNMRLFVGASSICSKAKAFTNKFGDAPTLLATGIRVATTVGSPVVNVRIGNFEDRYIDGGIEVHINEAIKVLKSMRTQALDAKIKFGFENHAGDLRSDELLHIIKEVGADVCGVMLDPGNAVWAMEDPMIQLKLLGPHVVCTSVRDYVTWQVPDGAMVQWTAIGQGQMDAPNYFKQLAAIQPQVPIFVESISNLARPVPFLTDAYWLGYPKVTAQSIAPFLAKCREGKALTIAAPPAGVAQKEFEKQNQQQEFLDSIAYLRKHCSAGLKA